MKLDKIIKLNEMSIFLEKNQISVEKSNIGIKLVTKNNVKVIISQQKHVVPGEKPLIYLDSFVNAYGLPAFKRNWHENENLSEYLKKIVIPYIVDLAGPFTVKESEIDDMIIQNLSSHGIKIDDNKRIDYTCKIFNSLGNEVESFISNRPVILFHFNGLKYGINYHKSCTNLLIFKNEEENEVVLTYPWHSFCSVFLEGKDYVDSAVSGIVNYIKKRSELR